MCASLRPWLNWIEQQISNLWVAGSSPAGRAINLKYRLCAVFLIYHVVSLGRDTFGKLCLPGSTTSKRKRTL